MNSYFGNALQTRGAEQYTLNDGMGNGMRFLYVRNGLGLEAWISIDRAGDISRLTFGGDNFGYFSPCGYVAPQYYEKDGAGFLKSFTAGFFTTCGLTTIGGPDNDDGEELPMHGNISNIPAVLNAVEEDENGLKIKLTITDAVIFGRKLVMHREYNFSYLENIFEVRDSVINQGDETSPYMILYHCNMGYPLLSEKSELFIDYDGITPRDDEAAKYTDTALLMEEPQKGFKERCYFYDVTENNGIAKVGIFNEDIGKGLKMTYSKSELPCFTEWKMMGNNDYVLGLEPGNATPDGRKAMRSKGTLRYINPDETVTSGIKFEFINNKNNF